MKPVDEIEEVLRVLREGDQSNKRGPSESRVRTPEGFLVRPCQLFQGFSDEWLTDTLRANLSGKKPAWTIRSLLQSAMICKKGDTLPKGLPFGNGKPDHVVIVLDGVLSAVCKQQAHDWRKSGTETTDFPYFAALIIQNEIVREFGLVAQKGGSAITTDNFAEVCVLTPSARLLCVPYSFFDDRSKLSPADREQLAWNLAGVVHSKVLTTHRIDRRLAGGEADQRIIGTMLALAGRLGEADRSVSPELGRLSINGAVSQVLVQGLSRVGSKSSADYVETKYKGFFHMAGTDSRRSTKKSWIDVRVAVPQKIRSLWQDLDLKAAQGNQEALKKLAVKAAHSMCHPITHPSDLDQAGIAEYQACVAAWQEVFPPKGQNVIAGELEGSQARQTGTGQNR